MAKFSVIIAAAGRSERFGGGEKKTFAKLDGRPIFLRSIEAFLGRDDVCQIILAVAREDVGDMKSSYAANLGFMSVKLIEGGERRLETIRLALTHIADEADFVAIHDAARPCVTTDCIDSVFAEAVKSGAAIPACPLVGTIKRVGDVRLVEQTVPRTGLYEAQTPQVFRKDILVNAFQRLGDANPEDITDDAQVVEMAGHPVFVVNSDATNLKITSKGDLALGNAILKARPAKSVRRLGAFEEAQW